MFAYCLNNPVVYSDSIGTRAQIWPVLFEDHDPGFIHRAVQGHIIATGLVEKELYLPGIGRADIFNPETHEMWEIKYGGSTSTMHSNRIFSADDQVSRYIDKSKKINNIIYQKGCAGAFFGGFILNCGNISYSVTYDTPAEGVILYYVTEMQYYVSGLSKVYVPSSLKNMSKYGLALAGLGLVVAIAHLGSGSSFDPLCCTFSAY